ncbi:hypothetical protein Ocin01_14340 [Orchesella cincta]|uniref:Uncharacterized protein n=1 Tax=Orchesella cincta TaxID=48709 RepID=A0A1D2MHE0_ORCCI|nr:hypothetical protein Ocin01_14339 [Orchesella cincta]ODM92343.1 hypothetical protein Ocin01_14340 [Orchesella cincta]
MKFIQIVVTLVAICSVAMGAPTAEDKQAKTPASSNLMPWDGKR